MHISITGDLGSGKSTVAKQLCKTLDFKFISTGAIQRKMALEKGMNTLEFNKYSDNNPEVDDYIDQHLKDINQGEQLYVCDSRLAWHFVKTSFKVYLLCFDKIAANRIINDKSRIGEPDADDVLKKIADSKARRKSENERFEKYYNIKYSIFKSFDLVVDTSNAGIEEVQNCILKQYELWKEKKAFTPIWFSPQRFLVTKKIAAVDKNDATNPIEIIKFNSKFYIQNGLFTFLELAKNINEHNLVAARLNALSAEEAQKFVETNFDETILNDWETEFDFKYYT